MTLKQPPTELDESRPMTLFDVGVLTLLGVIWVGFWATAMVTVLWAIR